MKGAKFVLLMEDPCVSLAQWMNKFLVGEFHIFPTKVDHALTLGVTMETLGVK